MKRILITGMSGVGKSSVIEELKGRGYPAFDIDTDEWCEWRTDANGNAERQWREDKVQELLEKEFNLTHLYSYRVVNRTRASFILSLITSCC